MYGDWDDFSKFIPFIIKELLLQKNEIKLTKGEQLRDFIYIDDVVEAFYLISQKGLNFKPGFYVYEYGTGKPQSLQSVVTLVKKLTGNTNTLLNFGALPYRENELFKSTSGSRKI